MITTSKRKRSSLFLTTALGAMILTLPVSLSGCGSFIDPSIMPAGYHTNKDLNRRSIFDIPTGYKYVEYRDKYYRDEIKPPENRPEIVLQDVQGTKLGWSQVGLDLALAIDDEIGLDTDRVTVDVESDKTDMRLALDHYVRDNLIDLEYQVKKHGQSPYHIFLNVTELEDSRRFVSSTFPEGSVGKLNEGGHTAVYDYEPRAHQDIQVETVIKRGDDIVSQTRSAHRLYLHTLDAE